MNLSLQKGFPIPVWKSMQPPQKVLSGLLVEKNAGVPRLFAADGLVDVSQQEFARQNGLGQTHQFSSNLSQHPRTDQRVLKNTPQKFL